MDWPQIGPKIAIKQGKKRQKDKWCLFRAPTRHFSAENGQNVDAVEGLGIAD